MKKSDIPNGPHYAIMIIRKVSVSIPGDLRSQTHPGHGYPASTEMYDDIQYLSFPDDSSWPPHQRIAVKEEWEKKVKELYTQEQKSYPPTRRPIVAFHVDSVARLNVEVELD